MKLSCSLLSALTMAVMATSAHAGDTTRPAKKLIMNTPMRGEPNCEVLGLTKRVSSKKISSIKVATAYGRKVGERVIDNCVFLDSLILTKNGARAQFLTSFPLDPWEGIGENNKYMEGWNEVNCETMYARGTSSWWAYAPIEPKNKSGMWWSKDKEGRWTAVGTRRWDDWRVITENRTKDKWLCSQWKKGR